MVRGSKVDEKNDVMGIYDNNAKPEVNVKDLTGRVCYFSLAGDLALEAYIDGNLSTRPDAKKKKLAKEALTERLFFALLMFDKVVLHCSDPLRSEIVLDVLKNFEEMIKQGRIVFIFSKHIRDIRVNYKNYINAKVDEYNDDGGLFSKKEADSLTQEHITEDYYEEVIKLLEQTPILVRRRNEEEFSFSNLVLNDLSSGFESILIDENATSSRILEMGLSLSQLLGVRVFSNSEGKFESHPVFQPDKISEIKTEIKKYLKQGNVISRVAIVDAIERKGIKYNEQREKIRDAIMMRMDILYCQMNCGNHLILEFHPAYEYKSIYQLNYFMEFINSLVYTDATNEKLDYELYTRLDKDKRLPIVRTLFISSMLDTREIFEKTLYNNEETKYKTAFKNYFKELIETRKDAYLTELNAVKKDEVG